MGVWHSDVYCHKCKRDVGVTYSDNKVKSKTGWYTFGQVFSAFVIIGCFVEMFFVFSFSWYGIFILPIIGLFIYFIFRFTKKKKKIDEGIYSAYCPICDSTILIDRNGKPIISKKQTPKDDEVLKNKEESESKTDEF